MLIACLAVIPAAFGWLLMMERLERWILPHENGNGGRQPSRQARNLAYQS